MKFTFEIRVLASVEVDAGTPDNALRENRRMNRRRYMRRQERRHARV